MCKLLNVSRSNYYTYQETSNCNDFETDRVKRIFRDSNNTYGTRRIKVECKREGIVISRRRIGRIMRQEGLISVYTQSQYKVHSSGCNESETGNELDREFDGHQKLETIVSDLTYVRVGNKWNYICTIIDLSNREIIGYSCGPHKTAQLVYDAFLSIKGDLRKVALFHTDRGREFMNQIIDDLLKTFEIKRSLSHKGTPYDNAVAEATFKTIKFEFVYQKRFEVLNQLHQEFKAYVWWYNNKRLHSTLGYISPAEHRIANDL